VKRPLMLVLALMVAGEAWAATVVLTGGKRIDVATYTVSGSYVTVQYANGRRESYPLSAVDLPATRDASGEKLSGAAASEPSGPHSPFLCARSATGAGAVVVTDADVKHVEPPEAEEEKKEAGNILVEAISLIRNEKSKAGLSLNAPLKHVVITGSIKHLDVVKAEENDVKNILKIQEITYEAAEALTANIT
jgi:hypothetical protein